MPAFACLLEELMGGVIQRVLRVIQGMDVEVEFDLIEIPHREKMACLAPDGMPVEHCFPRKSSRRRDAKWQPAARGG